MSKKPLVTYLRMFRKRSGLSQDDLGFLLGVMEGSSVSRHERASRIPTLRIALGYSYILGADMPELYEGLLWDLRATIRSRARGLRRSLERKPKNVQRDRKLVMLQRLIEDLPVPYEEPS